MVAQGLAASHFEPLRDRGDEWRRRLELLENTLENPAAMGVTGQELLLSAGYTPQLNVPAQTTWNFNLSLSFPFLWRWSKKCHSMNLSCFRLG